jgi:hypothetical protein
VGRLSSAIFSAIAAGSPVRQAWKIYKPRSAGGTSLDSVTIHDDIGGPSAVTDAGTYEVEGYNVTMQEPGRLTSGLYSFTADNSDAMFCSAASSNYWFNAVGDYQADPVECFVEHKLMIHDGSSWVNLVEYYGKVNDVHYDETAKTATVSSVAVAALSLGELWSADDAEEQDTGMDLVL